MRKAQAAQEFLMTYGWMLLVVIASIGALAYTGVVSPEDFIADRCILEPGVGCIDFRVDENSVTLILENGAGWDINISDISVQGCAGSAVGELDDGQRGTFVVDGCSNTVGDKFTGAVTLTYTNELGLTHENDGKIVGETAEGTSLGELSFTDSFNRADSDDVGNGWVEDEGGDAEARIRGNRLDFESEDDNNKPGVSHNFSDRTSGTMTWTFKFDFERTDDEKHYEVFMQLSDGSSPAVNLKWASDSRGMDEHEGFGYVVDGSVTQVAVVSGEATITVNANLNTKTYNLNIPGGSASNIPFDNNVTINTVRIYMHKLNDENFGDLSIDDISITG